MKILFYNHTGQVGGAERLLLMILGRLNRTSFDPVVICPEPGPLEEMVTELGVPAEIVAGLDARFTWRADHLVRYLKSFVHVILQLRKKVIIIKPDLIHANSVRAGLVATAATLGLRKRVVWHIHDLLPRHPFNTLIRAVGFLSARTRMIAVAQASADRFIGSFVTLRSRVTVILNGIDLEGFRPNQTARQKIRNELQLGEAEPVIGIVGRLTPSKGQLDLLRIFPRVLSEFPTATLMIVGAPAFNQEQEYLQLLKQTASELGILNRVRMLGARDDIATVMQALDLIVINSSTEACCLVALEAMACGTPVLATSVGGTPEMIRHGENGWLVPAQDHDALVTAILTLLRDESLRQKLGRNGRLEAVARFSIERFIQEVEGLYGAVLNVRGTPDHNKNARSFEPSLG